MSREPPSWASSYPLEVTYARQRAGLGLGLPGVAPNYVVRVDSSGRLFLDMPGEYIRIDRAAVPAYDVLVQRIEVSVRAPEPDAAGRASLQQRGLPYVYQGMYYAPERGYQGVQCSPGNTKRP